MDINSPLPCSEDIKAIIACNQQIPQSKFSFEGHWEVEKYIENIRKVSEERDSLMEELEAENEALKDEVRQLREELNGRKKEGTEAQLKQEHKIQIAKLTSELEKAVNDSKEKEKRIKNLDGEVKKLKLALLMEKRKKKVDIGNSGDSSRSSTMSESKIPLPKRSVQDGDGSPAEKLKELTAALSAEKKSKASYQATIIKLKALQNKNKKEITTLQNKISDLDGKNRSLEDRLKQSCSGSPGDRLQATDQNGSVKGELSQLSTPQLSHELEQLCKDSQAKTAELNANMLSLKEEKLKCRNLEGRLRETENKWEGIVSRYKSNEQDLRDKLAVLNRVVQQGRDEISSSQQEVMRLKSQQEIISGTPKSEAEQLTFQLIKEQELVQELKRRLERTADLERKMGDLRNDRDALAKELKTVVTREQKQQVDVGTLAVLENETKLLKDQLNENLKKQSDLLQDLNKLQKQNTDLSADLADARCSIKSSEETIKFLRGQLSRNTQELTHTFDFTRDGQSKMESEVVNLQRSLDEERRSLTHTNGDLKVRLEMEENKNKELTRVLKEKTEEVTSVRHEVSRLSLNSTKFEERMQEEAVQRRNVDSRNKVLEEELDKLWSQLKDVMEKHTSNEISKTELEGELYRLTNDMRDQQHNRASQQAEQLAAVKALSRAQQRAQTAERKIPELQEELDNTLLKLETAQTQSSDLAESRKEIHTLKEDLIKHRIELQEEKVLSSMLTKQLEDVQGQLKVTKEREGHLDQVNSDLKHQLLTVQTELSAIEDKQRNTEHKHLVSEQGKQSLQGTASSLQMEVHRLQVELTQTANQLENQSKKYMNLKLQMKEKMENARDIFNRQKSAMVGEIEQVQETLNDVRGELDKECNDKEETKKKNQALLSDNRQLMEKMAENEEAMNDKNRNISSLEYRTKFLEQENGMLQDRISTLSRQRAALEKVVREYRLEKQKEDIYKVIGTSPTNGGHLTPSSGLALGIPRVPFSSGLGNSLNNSVLSGTDVGRPGVSGLLIRSQDTPAAASNYQPLDRESPRVGAGSDGMIDDTEGR